MKIDEFNYNLPPVLIAQSPVNPRDHSRMLILNKKTGAISHKHFFDLPNLITDDYILVFNETRVMPARVFTEKPSGGKLEILFLEEINPPSPRLRRDKTSTWEVLIRGKVYPIKSSRSEEPKGLFDRASVGLKINLDKNLGVEIVGRKKEIVLLKVNQPKQKLLRFLEKSGHMPLPPYIKTKMKEHEARKKYQTIFARITGSAAAPTASLHFTKRILKQLKENKIQTAFINLEVGWGTFAPVKVDQIEKHKIHHEKVIISRNTADFLNEQKRLGKKILAVGTTVARALESATDQNGLLHEFNNKTSLYIYPPYQFKFVDALLTNFHLPKSSLLFLVSAFAGRKNIFKAYREAIKKKYRFFSFGDCMLIK